MKKLAVLVILVLVLSIGAYAQMFAGATYHVTIPFKDTKDFVSKTSWLGFGLEIRKIVAENFTLGIEMDWVKFSEDVTIGPITEKRTINSYPALITANYYVGNKEGFMSYIGLGAGIYYIRNKWGNLMSDNIHLGLAPELGFIYRIKPHLGLLASVKHNHAFEAGGWTHTYWTVKVGVLWRND